MGKLVAVDLFCGGGGLTVGLKKAGFSVCAAVELDGVAADTYRENHPETVVFSKDIRKVSASELLRTSPTNKIDLIAACPPCQSFSSLTAKYKKSDPRDELINEFARLVRTIRPKAIMMENVPGLAQKGSHLFNPVVDMFRELGYHVEHKVLEVADYGVPQRRKRLVLLGVRRGSIAIPVPTHSERGSNGTAPWRTVADVIRGISKPKNLLAAKLCGGPRSLNWHVSRNLSEVNIQRLKALSPGSSRTELPTHLRPKCHQNDHGFTNVYGRMSWDKPAPTITGGCTTMSKGRFGHPEDLRTISVREAALLQTFPADYKFATDYIDKACVVIGNALPPLFAEAMARACAQAIKKGSRRAVRR